MSKIDYAVRGTDGSTRYGAFEDARRASFSVQGDKDVSLNLNPAAVSEYQRVGNDLLVQLTNGKTLVLEGFFADSATGDKTLYLSENGVLLEVDLANDDGALVASYELVEAGGKWGSFDDLVFLDLELVEPVVAPLVAPLLGGLGAAAAAGGAALLVGGDGDGGGGGQIVPTVDDADVPRIIGGTGPDGVSVSGTGEKGSTVLVTIGDQVQETTIGDDGTWVVVFDPAGLPGDGIYVATVDVTAPDGDVFELDGPSVDIDTTAPEILVDGGTVSVGDSVNAADHLDGTVITGSGEAGASVSVEIGGVTHSTTVSESGRWSVTFASAEIATGEYETAVTIVTTDARGNATTVTDSLLVDTVAPPATIDTVAIDDVINADEASGAVTISGTGEAGAVMVVEFQGTSQTATVGANGTWTVSYAASSIAPGTYDSTITVTATDAVGNSFSTSQTVHIDTENAVTLDGPVSGDNVINADEAAAGVSLTGTAEPGASVIVTLAGVSKTVTATTTGTWSASFSSADIPAGDYDAAVSVQSTDAAGNVTTTSGTVHVDTVAALSLDPTQAGDNIINGQEAASGVTLTGTAEPGDEVLVTMQGVTRTVSADASGSWSALFSSAEIPAGEYDADVSVMSTDAAGNTATTSGTVRVDTQTAVGLASPIAGDNVINATEAQAGVALSGTAEPGAQVQVTLQGVTHTVQANASGTWNSVFTQAEIPGGEYDAVVTVTATDLAGNSESTSGTVHVDTTTTVSFASGQAGGDNIVNAQEVQSGITLTGSAEAGSTVQVTLAGVTRAATVDAGGNWSAVFEPGSLPGGEFDTVASVTSTDAAGNAATATTAMRIDTVAGNVALSGAPIELDDVINAVERADGVEISGIATPGLMVTVGLGGATHQVLAAPNGAWSTLFVASEIPTGTRTLPITASIVDGAGNTMSVSDTVGLDTQVDNHGISLASIEGDDIVNFDERADGVTITGTTEPGSTVSVQIGSASHNATVDAAGNWTVSFAAGDIPDGEYDTQITATATDAAGNVSTVSDSVRIDTLVSNLSADPAQTADDIINASEMASGVTLTGTTEPGSTVMVELGGVTQSATVAANGNWTVSFAPGVLPQGTYTATAAITATDAAGNTATLSESFNVDTEVDTPDVDAVTFLGADVGRVSATGDFENFSVNTLSDSGTVASPGYSTSTHPVFGTEFTFDTPVPDGTHLVINAVDDAGNKSSTLLVLDDNATNAGVIDNAGLAGFDIHALNLEYASDTNLTLTQAQIQNLSGTSDTLTIHGGADDTVTIAAPVLSTETQVNDGKAYNVYTVGDGSTTLIIEQDINVII